MTDDIIATDAHRLASKSSVFVSLYELEMGGTTYYFHSEAKEGDIVFDGNTYSEFPIFLEGVEIAADGAVNRPTLSIANVKSLLDSNTKSDLGLPSTFELNDLIGSRITKRQTLEKYTGVGVTAYEFPVDTYLIDRITNRNQLMIQMELTSPFDFGGKRVPSRIVTGKYCPWVYKGYNPEALEDTASACKWTNENQIRDPSGSSYSYFFTIDDEPLVKESLSAITTASSYNANATYGVENIVTFEGLYWASKTNDNDGNTPSESAVNWKLLRTFSVWSTDSTGAKSYTVDAIDPRKSSYVYHANTVWRCLKAHTKDAGIIPGSNNIYWTPGDVCGKLLTSCKVRYQAKRAVVAGDTGNNARPLVSAFDTSKILPFGGFPGTRKYR
jgi:lambda family phage minor tail protein L